MKKNGVISYQPNSKCKGINMSGKTKFVMRPITMNDVNKFKELDKSKYAEKKKPKKIKRSMFDSGLSEIQTRFE